MIVRHKLLASYPLQGKKILVIGTFNPDVPCNKATFFYGRAKNFFWTLLPEMFNETNLKGDIEAQKAFLQRHSIELSDLIVSVRMRETDICNYGDDKLGDVQEWSTQNILDVLACGTTREVYFTRKSFDKKVENIRIEICKIKNYCDEHGIKFRFLPTPSRFYNEQKCNEWRECFR
ncbi:MAG: hypothetical protein PHI89_07990 [Thiovulaceae bacterium]|jgi:G:T/U-mismatch repair DNA glycosylase|nr:hypothetical protein [Sulfurimonadaceae bacterium]